MWLKLKKKVGLSINKKGDERVSLITLVEIALIALIVIVAFQGVSNLLDHRDLIASQYSSYYSFITTNLDASPGDIVLISNDALDSKLSFDSKTINLVGVSYSLDDGTNKKISASPYLRTNFNSIFRKSDLSSPVYFIKYGDKMTISNIG